MFNEEDLSEILIRDLRPGDLFFLQLTTEPTKYTTLATCISNERSKNSSEACRHVHFLWRDTRLQTLTWLDDERLVRVTK